MSAVAVADENVFDVVVSLDGIDSTKVVVVVSLTFF